jgi:hypothetical protein
MRVRLPVELVMRPCLPNLEGFMWQIMTVPNCCSQQACRFVCACLLACKE